MQSPFVCRKTRLPPFLCERMQRKSLEGLCLGYRTRGAACAKTESGPWYALNMLCTPYTRDILDFKRNPCVIGTRSGMHGLNEETCCVYTTLKASAHTYTQSYSNGSHGTRAIDQLYTQNEESERTCESHNGQVQEEPMCYWDKIIV